MTTSKMIKCFIISVPVFFNSCIISDYDKPSSIYGKVTDSANKGISDVIIFASSHSNKDSVVTVADGTYKINLLQSGTVDLLFSKVGFTSKAASSVVLGGEKKVFDISLNSLSEDAYFRVDTKEKILNNNEEGFSVAVETNILYDVKCDTQWITSTKMCSGLTFHCQVNETLNDRFATVILKAEYNHNDTIRIKQLAGPVLRVIDYLGNNNTSFPQTKPFVTFSREVSVVSATSLNQNVPYEISADKKTISFSNIKLNLFSQMPIQLKVLASDGIQLDYNLNVKFYLNSQLSPPINDQVMFFSNDNQYAWVYTQSGSSRILRKFSCVDFSEQTSISFDQPSQVYYNPYNNSFYHVSTRFFEDRYVSDVSVYSAATGLFTTKFTIDNNGNCIFSMAFSVNGYGLMLIGSSVYYIDSSNNHKWGLYSNHSMLYDPHQSGSLLPSHIEMCNNNKTFVLWGVDGSVFVVNAETKVLSRAFKTDGYYYAVSSNFSPTAYYFYESTKSIVCQNVLDKTTKTLSLPINGIRNLAALASDGSDPYLFTSECSLVSTADNSIYNFAHQGECYHIKSSNDGKLIMINNNYVIYLFKSEVFTKYHNYIK